MCIGHQIWLSPMNTAVLNLPKHQAWFRTLSTHFSSVRILDCADVVLLLAVCSVIRWTEPVDDLPFCWSGVKLGSMLYNPWIISRRFWLVSRSRFRFTDSKVEYISLITCFIVFNIHKLYGNKCVSEQYTLNKHHVHMRTSSQPTSSFFSGKAAPLDRSDLGSWGDRFDRWRIWCVLRGPINYVRGRIGIRLELFFSIIRSLVVFWHESICGARS